MTLLICLFGRNQNFKPKTQRDVLPPKEQEVIQMALKKAGVTQLMEFDEYITAINWILTKSISI